MAEPKFFNGTHEYTSALKNCRGRMYDLMQIWCNLDPKNWEDGDTSIEAEKHQEAYFKARIGYIICYNYIIQFLINSYFF